MSSKIRCSQKCKTLAEAGLGAFIIFGYIWWVIPRRISWMHAVFPLIFVLLLLYSKISREESLKDLGIRLDNWYPSFKIQAAVMIPFAVILFLIWKWIFPVNYEFYKALKFWKRLFTYPLWAFIQQYMVLAFFFRRLREIFAPGYFWAIFCTAILFAAAHIPNYPLILTAFFSGLFTAWVYHKYNNLITIALFHGIFAVFFLNILLMYFTFGPFADAGRWTKAAPAHSSIDAVNFIKPNRRNSPVSIEKSEKYFTVRGWAAGKQAEIDNVFIMLNGKAYRCEYGIKRDDVAKVHENPGYRYSGYQVKIPLSDLKPGYYFITLKIRFKNRSYSHYPGKMAWIRIGAERSVFPALKSFLIKFAA